MPLTQHTEQEVKKLVDAMPTLAQLKANGIADGQIVTLDRMEWCSMVHVSVVNTIVNT